MLLYKKGDKNMKKQTIYKVTTAIYDTNDPYIFERQWDRTMNCQQAAAYASKVITNWPMIGQQFDDLVDCVLSIYYGDHEIMKFDRYKSGIIIYPEYVIRYDEAAYIEAAMMRAIRARCMAS
jgi:hypothetical protein